MRPPIYRNGGKTKLKKRIIQIFPKDYESMTYVEPFIGGGSVFFEKNPSTIEIINDLDKHVSTIFKGLKKYGKSIGNINVSISKDKYNTLQDTHYKSLKRETVRNMLLCINSFMGALRRNSYFNPSKKEINMRDYSSYEDRLKNTVVLNTDALKVIKKYDSPNTLFYLDPPYEGSTCELYKHNVFDYDALAKLLKRIKGKFILSINDSDKIRELFKEYQIHEVSVNYGFLKKNNKRTELIITNF
jgi:DNA adenine methylase